MDAPSRTSSMNNAIRDCLNGLYTTSLPMPPTKRGKIGNGRFCVIAHLSSRSLPRCMVAPQLDKSEGVGWSHGALNYAVSKDMVIKGIDRASVTARTL